MLFVKCPSCKTQLANKQILFEERLEEICNNEKLTEKQKNEQKKKLLDDLNLKRYCCRMRMLTYIREELILV